MDGRSAVVVVNHGSHAMLEQYLAPLAAELEAQVVVVDNSTTEESRAAAFEVASSRRWHLVQTPNDGFGAGVNRGVTEAVALGCDTFLVLNPDLGLDADAARALLDAARSDPSVLVGPRIVRSDGRVWSVGGELDLTRGRTTGLRAGPVAWISGACFAMTVSTWSDVGGFDDAFFLYWEDVDLSFRMTTTGRHLVVRDDLTAVHEVGGTQDHSGTRRKSDVYYRHNCRSRLVFAARNLDRAAQRRWVLRAPAFAWEVLLRGGRRQLLRSPGPVWAAIRGTSEGAWFVARHGGRAA